MHLELRPSQIDIMSWKNNFCSSDLSWLDYSCTGPEGAFSDALITVECFGGCARLTRALCDIGFDGTAIDWIRNKSRPVAPLVLLDLTTEYGRTILFRILRSGRCAYVHLAPPCGTASLARNIPLHPSVAAFVHTPQPLRSNQYPNGIPGLCGQDLLRVEAANKLYEITAQAARIAEQNNVAWSIENPRSSLFWQTTFMCELIDHLKSIGKPSKWVEFQNCAYNGDRPKWTGILHNIDQFQELRATCPGNHEHKPWGVSFANGGTKFSTSEEAAYPVDLCLKMAELVKRHVSTKVGAPLRLLPVSVSPTVTGMHAAEAGKQARGHKAPRLVPEYAAVEKFAIAEEGFAVIEGQVLRKEVQTLGKPTCRSKDHAHDNRYWGCSGCLCGHALD